MIVYVLLKVAPSGLDWEYHGVTSDAAIADEWRDKGSKFCFRVTEFVTAVPTTE